MNSILVNKPKLLRKKNVGISEGKGVKDDVSIFRLVAQSNRNSLSVTELRSKTRTNSIYKLLDRLSPRTDNIPGEYLFCFNELFKDHESDESKDKEIEKLLEKLKKSYNHFLKWQNWREIKLEFKPRCKNANKVISIHLNKNNSITLKLIPKGIQDKDKAILKFRKKVELHDISKYTRAHEMILSFCRLGGINSEIFSFKINKNYITFKVPLLPERRGGKLYFRTLTERSYYCNKQKYLDSTLNEKGQRLVKSYTNRGESLSSTNSSTHEKNKEKIRRLREKISRVYEKRKYQTLGLNVRGLLSYALEESNYSELNKSLENLARSDIYQQIKDSIYTYDEYGEKSKFPTSSYCYRIKSKFPFLAYYNDLKNILLVRYTAILLRRIARNLKDGLKIIGSERLKYLVTKEFFEGIKSLLIQYSQHIHDDNKSDNNVSRAG